ncbi:MAG: hypothetical protein AB7P76_08555 [Candidatus Melainabacteria bacterium]
MPVTTPPPSGSIPAIPLAVMPEYRFHSRTASSTQIGLHLAWLMKKFGKTCTLRIPSVLSLSGFYHRSIPDVLGGLYSLQEKGIHYLLHGLDGEVVLYEPGPHSLKNSLWDYSPRRKAG